MYLCSQCPHIGQRFLKGLPYVFNRRASQLANPSFTSFFFDNGQLKTNPTRSDFLENSRQITHTLWRHDPPAHHPIANLSSFREAEILTPRRLLKVYAQLAKSRLTILNVLTAMSGVALSPLPTTLPILLSTAIGTTLCSASANTLNQLQEVPFDAQMTRTRMRPLVRRAISPVHAAAFAAACGIAGPAVLLAVVNPTTATLGVVNIALYAGVYTWMKRKTVVNTWVGAVVGAVPPLMGWTACGGKLFPSSLHTLEFFPPTFLSSYPNLPIDLTSFENPLAPLAFFMLLFHWQFPHFNSLSYIVRGSYAQAGYHMLSVLNPSHNALVSLRHAVLLIPVCSILVPLSGLTTWTFALTSLFPNIFCARAAWKFWTNQGEKEARAVFQHYLWYLPVILGLMMTHKQGIDWLQWKSVEEDKSGRINDK